MGADYSFEVKTVEIWAPTFFKHNDPSVAKYCVQKVDFFKMVEYGMNWKKNVEVVIWIWTAEYLSNSCSHVVKDFESEAKSRFNF